MDKYFQIWPWQNYRAYHDSAGYVICPAKSEWQITFANFVCKPRLTLFRVLYSKYYYMNLIKIRRAVLRLQFPGFTGSQ